MKKFDYFVVFAEMRTGSNFLESNLNALQGVSCHGEAFNTHFLGYPKHDEILGITQHMRDRDPNLLLDQMQNAKDALHGFRYFHNHDPRILERCLQEKYCAKIILTRNPLDSYVSWKIAQKTGQWKLTDSKARKDTVVKFDAEEFEAHLEAAQEFQVKLLSSLQKTGQTAFYLSYEDLQDLEVMNGLARFLGVKARLETLDNKLKKQNPSPLSQKVENPDEMEAAVANLDRFNLNRTPNFEPRRGPSISDYIATQNAGLLYLPIQGGPKQAILEWMAAVDQQAVSKLLTKMSQKDLRQWKRKHVGHQSFTVLRHPVLRAHDVFCRYILPTDQNRFSGPRKTMRRRYALPIPQDFPDASYDLAAHRAAFLAFLKFLKHNLDGQTGVRVDAAWASQAQIMKGFGEFSLPNFIIHEDKIELGLSQILQTLGYPQTDIDYNAVTFDTPFGLRQIYDDEIEDLVQKVYRRDYLMFGFDRWLKI